MHKFGKFAAVALLALPVTAFAEGLSYNYVDAGFITGDADGVDFDGFGAEISGKIADSFYLFGSYGALESDPSGIETDTIVAGLGLRHGLAKGTDLNVEASVVNADVEVTGFGSDDDTGYGLGVGIRHQFTQQFEVGGSVDYVDIFEDDSTAFTVQGLFHFTPALSARVAYSTDDDVDSWTFGGRFNF